MLGGTNISEDPLRIQPGINAPWSETPTDHSNYETSEVAAMNVTEFGGDRDDFLAPRIFALKETFPDVTPSSPSAIPPSPPMPVLPPPVSGPPGVYPLVSTDEPSDGLFDPPSHSSNEFFRDTLPQYVA